MAKPFTLDDEAMVARIWRGHKRYWDLLGTLDAAENHTGTICWLSGNIQFTYAVEAEDPATIKQLVQGLKKKAIPVSFILSPYTPAEQSKALLKTGDFMLESAHCGMAKTLSNIPPASRHERLNIYRVQAPGQMKACGTIFNSCFEYDIFSYDNYLSLYRDENTFFYLAEFDGLPVGACMAIQEDDFMEISWVGTIPGYRKRGIAGEILYAAEIDALQNGKKAAVLCAADTATNAYSRVGYREYCPIHVLRYTGERFRLTYN